MNKNRAEIMGFMGKDAEVRTGSNDKQFTTFSVATSERYKDKESGEYKTITEWHNCIAFGKLGEFAANLKKGEHVYLEGKIQHREYKTAKAKKPVRTDNLLIYSILKLDRAAKAAPEDAENEPVIDEEIPF
jgi:single-strand DNA-binding protein